jgi:hypothetical protein
VPVKKCLSSQARPSPPELQVNAHGFSLHAAVRWRADQRKELEELCRYISRPVIANERIKRNRASQVVLQPKSWDDVNLNRILLRIVLSVAFSIWKSR